MQELRDRETQGTRNQGPYEHGPSQRSRGTSVPYSAGRSDPSGLGASQPASGGKGKPASNRPPSGAPGDKRRVRVVAAVVEKEGRYLITQRRANAVLPHLWEFPGGRCESGESNQEALVREIQERLAAEVGVKQLISFVSHAYDDYIVDLYLYECELLSERLRCDAVQAYRWVTSEEFDAIPFTPADEASMASLLGEDP